MNNKNCTIDVEIYLTQIATQFSSELSLVAFLLRPENCPLIFKVFLRNQSGDNNCVRRCVLRGLEKLLNYDSEIVFKKRFDLFYCT